MHFLSRRSFLALATLLPVAFLQSACSGGATGPTGELAPLVGTWRAEILTLTNQANPDQVVHLIEQGATFTISIIANGQYHATLEIFQQGNQELGIIAVSGNQITLTRTSPPGPSTTGTWRFQGETLIIDGDTEFDFNVDGTNEQATVHFELNRIEL